MPGLLCGLQTTNPGQGQEGTGGCLKALLTRGVKDAMSCSKTESPDHAQTASEPGDAGDPETGSLPPTCAEGPYKTSCPTGSSCK